MMKKNIFSLALAASLMGCGGGGAGDFSASGDINGIVHEGPVAMALYNFLEMMIKPVDFQNNLLPDRINAADMPLAGIAGKDLSTCASYIRGDVDADEAEIRWDCKDIPMWSPVSLVSRNGFLRWSRTGTSSAVDLSKGYLYEFDIAQLEKADNGKLSESRDIGKHGLINDGAKVTYSHELSWSYKTDRYLPALIDWSWESRLKHSFAPNDPSLPLSQGTGKVDMEAAYRMKGKVAANGGQTIELDHTLEFKTTPGFEYDNDCAHNFKNGAIVGKDGAGNEFRYEFDCDNSIITYNGEEFDPLTP